MRMLPVAVSPVFLSDIFFSFFHKNKMAREFEKYSISYFGKKKIYTFSSLMRGCYVCFRNFSTDSRREIILPRYSCPSFAHGALAAHMDVRYCDIDPRTLSIDISSLKSALSSKTAAVVCANLFGLTSEIDEVVNVCKEREIPVIEGVDYGIGTEYEGNKIGTFGDAVILNFQEGKALPVGGCAILIRNPDSMRTFFLNNRIHTPSLKHVLRMICYSFFSRPDNYAIFRKVLFFLGLHWQTFSMEDTIRKTKKEVDYSLDENDPFLEISMFQKALAGRLFLSLEKYINIRFKNAELLRSNLFPYKNLYEIVPNKKINNIHYIRYPILVSADRRRKILYTLYRNGIEASSMYNEWGMKIRADEFPGAYRVMNELITLPCHPFVERDDILRMTRIIHDICK